jgi:hypothetical protein
MHPCSCQVVALFEMALNGLRRDGLPQRDALVSSFTRTVPRLGEPGAGIWYLWCWPTCCYLYI